MTRFIQDGRVLWHIVGVTPESNPNDFEMFEVRDVECYADGEGGWTVNNSHTMGYLVVSSNSIKTNRQLADVLRDVGILSSKSAGRVAFDELGVTPTTIQVLHKGNREPFMELIYVDDIREVV